MEEQRSKSMKATDLLKSQHQDIMEMFEKLQDGDADDASQRFDDLARALVAHDAIEREIFYPLCEELLGETDELMGAVVEHRVMEFCLYVAMESLGKDDFGAKIGVLRKVVLEHLEDEEDALLPRIDGELDEDRLEKVGEQMEEHYEQAESASAREALQEALTPLVSSLLKRGAPAKGNGAGPRRPKRTRARAAQ